MSETKKYNPTAEKDDSAHVEARDKHQDLLIMWDFFESFGRPSEMEKRGVFKTREEFLEFGASLNPQHVKFFLHMIAVKTDKWNAETLMQKMELFKSGSLPLNEKEAEEALVFLGRDKKEVEQAKKLGMELMLFRGVAAADRLTHAVVVDRAMDIETPEGQELFLKEWQKNCPNIPPPCVPGKSYGWWYLTQLKHQNIVCDISDNDPNKRQTVLPQFSQGGFIWVDKWQEVDWDSAGEDEIPDAHHSELLKKFLTMVTGAEDDGRTVKRNREDIDVALWDGDPADRKQSSDQIKFLKKYGFDPKEWELRLIRQDEYARGAKAMGWGEHNLWNNFDHFFRGDGGYRYGLRGGRRAHGGPSRVVRYWRDDSSGHLAVRLVLQRKQKDSDSESGFEW